MVCAQEVQVVHEPQYAEPQYTSVSPVVPYSFLPYAANYKYYYNWGQARSKTHLSFCEVMLAL